MKTLEGSYQARESDRFAIVATRFNDFIVSHLIAGARDVLMRHGVAEDKLTLVRVPGAWELPVVTARLAKQQRHSAIIALGAVIRGSTPHFDVVVDGACRGLGQIALEADVPVLLGLLTTDTLEQAIERAGTKAGNKGAEAAMAALELCDLQRAITAPLRAV